MKGKFSRSEFKIARFKFDNRVKIRKIGSNQSFKRKTIVKMKSIFSRSTLYEF
jgi:hypothetical protein